MKKTTALALIAFLCIAALLAGARAHAASPAGSFKTPEEAVQALAGDIE